MSSFYLAYEKVPQAVGQLEGVIFQIPWGHNAIILERIKDPDERLWYIEKTIENSWSQSLLEAAIKSKLYKREGKAITNFEQTLPAPHSKSAQQALKDPYLFDSITLPDDHFEHEVERGLIDNVR